MRQGAGVSWRNALQAVCDAMPPLLRSANCLYTVAAIVGLLLLLAFHQVVEGSAERAALQRQALREAAAATGVSTVPEPQR